MNEKKRIKKLEAEVSEFKELIEDTLALIISKHEEEIYNLKNKLNQLEETNCLETDKEPTAKNFEQMHKQERLEAFEKFYSSIIDEHGAPQEPFYDLDKLHAMLSDLSNDLLEASVLYKDEPLPKEYSKTNNNHETLDKGNKNG